MSLATARAALVDALGTIEGLRVFDWPMANAQPPMCHVALESIDYDVVLGPNSTGRLSFAVRVYVGRADDRTAVAALDPYLAPTGTQSIRAAIDADDTLGAVVDAARLVECRNVGVYEIGGVMLLGAELVVDIVD